MAQPMLDLHQQFQIQALTLKPFSKLNSTESDFVWMMRNHPDIAKWMGSGGQIPLEAHHAFMARQLMENSNFNYLVCDQHGVSGVISLHRCDWRNCIAWLGIYRNPFRQETGLGRQLLNAICWLAFDIANLHTLKLEVVADNTPAITAYLRAGFINEGCWREAVRRDENYIDLLLMGMKEQEWRNK